MAETIGRLGRAGLTSLELDRTGRPTERPSGVGAGIIGTSKVGPAFVPIIRSNFDSWVKTFGESDGEMFGPIAVAQWLANQNACTYIRVLGVGDGKKRTTDGSVTSAGFVVGDEIPNSRGIIGHNRYAVNNFGTGDGYSPLGRTYFLSTYMSDSIGSSYLRDSGLQQAPKRPFFTNWITK